MKPLDVEPIGITISRDVSSNVDIFTPSLDTNQSLLANGGQSTVKIMKEEVQYKGISLEDLKKEEQWLEKAIIARIKVTIILSVLLLPHDNNSSYVPLHST